MARLASWDETLSDLTSGLVEFARPEGRHHREPYDYALGVFDVIRLVVIDPGDWDTPISCRLLYRRLNQGSDYVALSYAWGSPRATKPVLVNDVEVQVTVNLESALRHIRRRKGPRTIWIDAIVSIYP